MTRLLLTLVACCSCAELRALELPDDPGRAVAIRCTEALQDEVDKPLREPWLSQHYVARPAEVLAWCQR
jgi:hypothetical protein